MGTTKRLLRRVKQTGLGGACAWLLRPRKHRADIRRQLEQRLPYPPTAQQIRWCFWDYFRFCLRHRGDLVSDYFGAQLYRKSEFVRRESMAHGVRHGWRDAVQDKALWDIFQDKRAFYAAFAEHLHRHWMVADHTTQWEQFSHFVQECSGVVFAKPPRGMGGREVKRWELTGEEDCKALFEHCRKSPMVLEEVLTQCEELRAFSDGAVNTLRMITIIDQAGAVHVARAELRMARSGMDIDNYCSGGIVAQVDVATGVIFTTGRDENGKEYIVHPDTGVQIVGFCIPRWERYVEFVRLLAGLYPGMRYVGWDILEDRDGRLCVIEGNKDAGAGGLESGLLYGLRPYYEALLQGGTDTWK